MSLAISQRDVFPSDQTSIDIDLTDDSVTAGKDSSKKKASEPKPAGHEDSTTASTWDAGSSTKTNPSSKHTRSSNVQLRSVQVDHDDSDDDVSDNGKSGRTSQIGIALIRKNNGLLARVAQLQSGLRHAIWIRR
mgnify:CR=1 FL=1